MRARKKILVVCAHVPRLREWRYVLDVRGYAVLCAASMEQARECISEEVAAVLCDSFTLLPWPELTARLKDAAPYTPILLIRHADPVPYADAIFTEQNISNSHVIERLRILAIRRTGPRKKSAVSAAAEEGSDARRSESVCAVAG